MSPLTFGGDCSGVALQPFGPGRSYVAGCALEPGEPGDAVLARVSLAPFPSWLSIDAG